MLHLHVVVGKAKKSKGWDPIVQTLCNMYMNWNRNKAATILQLTSTRHTTTLFRPPLHSIPFYIMSRVMRCCRFAPRPLSRTHQPHFIWLLSSQDELKLKAKYIYQNLRKFLHPQRFNTFHFHSIFRSHPKCILLSSFRNPFCLLCSSNNSMFSTVFVFIIRAFEGKYSNATAGVGQGGTRSVLYVANKMIKSSSQNIHSSHFSFPFTRNRNNPDGTFSCGQYSCRWMRCQPANPIKKWNSQLAD